MIARISISALFMAGVGLASAQTMSISGLVYGSSTDTVYINYTDTANPSTDIVNEDVYAGPFSATLNTNNGSVGLTVFCCDVLHETDFTNTDNVTLEKTTDLGANYEKAAQIYNTFDPVVGSDLDKNAALQIAIWDTLFNAGTTSFSYSGESSNVASLVTTYETTYNPSASDLATKYDFSPANQQDMFGGAQAVPEPCSMIALGLGAFGLLRRRK